MQTSGRMRRDMLRANDALVLSSGRAIQVVEAVTHQDGTTHHWLASKFPTA